MKRFVLIRKGQVGVDGAHAARLVGEMGFAEAAQTLGVGDTTLRAFLRDEGYRFKRETSWQVEHLPGLEGQDGSTNEAGGGGDGVQAATASTPEPAGTGA